MRLALKILASLVALALLAAAAGFVYLTLIGVFGASKPGRKVAIRIPRGSTASDIGALLEKKRVIQSAQGFRIRAFVDGGAEAIQAGRYRMPRGLTAGDALSWLSENRPIQDLADVTIREGAWVTDFADAVAAQTSVSADAFLAAANSGKVRSKIQPRGETSLEGLMFPSTYEVRRRDTALDLVELFVDEFDRRIARLDLGEVKDRGISAYEAVIVASMVEAEARVQGDRDKIAAVIYNRLEERMTLGVDATIRYALRKRSGPLTQSDLAVESPYNSRLVPGLPPTPIGAPGMASLKAAADPAAGDWLYYVVSDCKGHHAFSVAYEDFLDDKARYEQLDC